MSVEQDVEALAAMAEFDPADCAVFERSPEQDVIMGVKER
jgi:hypothetical protein